LRSSTTGSGPPAWSSRPLPAMSSPARYGNAYFPALATHIFEYAERQRAFAALTAI
jgi:hypothetical protein